jgi:hypothetical protein
MKCPICETEIIKSEAGYCHPPGSVITSGQQCLFNGDIANEREWQFAIRAVKALTEKAEN